MSSILKKKKKIEIFGIFFIRNSFISDLTIMIIIYQNEVDFDFHLKNKTMS